MQQTKNVELNQQAVDAVVKVYEFAAQVRVGGSFSTEDRIAVQIFLLTESADPLIQDLRNGNHPDVLGDPDDEVHMHGSNEHAVEHAWDEVEYQVRKAGLESYILVDDLADSGLMVSREHLLSPEQRIADWRSRYAKGTLPKWRVTMIERTIRGWTWQ